jgi:hypothetical protein
VGFLSRKRRKPGHTDCSISILDRPLVGEKVVNHEYRSESDSLRNTANLANYLINALTGQVE